MAGGGMNQRQFPRPGYGRWLDEKTKFNPTYYLTGAAFYVKGWL